MYQENCGPAQACARYQDETLRVLTGKRIQVDEIWSFVGMKKKKKKNVPAERKDEFGLGDAWTWTGSSTRIPSWPCRGC